MARMIISYFYRCFLYCFLHHIPRPQYDLSKLISHPVQDALVQAMNNPLCGIYIFWGIQCSGKTAYSSWMAEQLGQTGRHIWHLDSHSLVGRHSAMVMRKICENLPGQFQFNPRSPPPTTIVIDNFDQVWASGGDKHSDRLIHCTTAGTPGFVVWSANRKSLKQIEQTAKEMEKRWTHGLRVLQDFLL